MGHTIERPPMPTEDRGPAWRRACLAFREMRQAGVSDLEAHEAAVAAVQTVLPLSWKEASAKERRTASNGSQLHIPTDQIRASLP